MTRRQLLVGASATGIVGLGAYAFGIEPRWVSVEYHDLPIPDLPDHLVDSRAVQISDLHVGRVGDAYLRRQFRFVDSLDPDFVFFTGDFVDDSTNDYVERARVLLKDFPRGKLGTACVLGNHDFGNSDFDARQNIIQNEMLIEHFAEARLNLLRDGVVEFSGLKVAGLRDYWFGRFNNTSAWSAIKQVSQAPSIVLSHNPDTVDLKIWSGYESWVLCGHTHGGQCKFPIVGTPRLPVENRTYVAGKYQVAGGHKMYINRGIGHTMRVRFMARPEITVFKLTRAV